MEQARSGGLSRLRRAISSGKGDQARRPRPLLQRGSVQVQSFRRNRESVIRPNDLSYLYSLTNEYRSIRYDLGNMQALAAALGNPQAAFRSVLIAGTNGKGSVAKLLSSMMPEAGLYTSPHLVRLNERIQIGNREISDDDLNEVFAPVKQAASAGKDLL